MSFDHLIQQLTRRTRRQVVCTGHGAERITSLSKTERIRTYLREVGPANSATLAMEADVPSCALVGALLKGDLARGSVVRDGARYVWNNDWDSKAAEQIRQAKALLKRHGYTVIRGTR